MTIVVWGFDQADQGTFASAVGGAVTPVSDAAALLRSLRGSRDVSLVVLGPGIPHHRALHAAARVRVERPGTLLVLVRSGTNRLERQSARDAGVDAVLSAGDVTAAGLSCREFLTARAAGGRGRVVTVFAAKGGCGKTMLATNIAVALAESPDRRVCLVDLDLRFGDLAVTLGLPPQGTIASRPRMDPDGLSDVVTTLGPRLDCVLAPARPGEAERLELDGVDDLLAALAQRYDAVVVDTPATFSGPVISALDRSEHHVLVTTPERPALQSLRRTLDTLDLLGHRRDNRSVIFNRSDSGVGITADDVERTLHAPVAAHIPSSRDVPTSINSCLPLMSASPDHPVSSAIRHFALARLVSPAAVPPAVLGGAMT